MTWLKKAFIKLAVLIVVLIPFFVIPLVVLMQSGITSGLPKDQENVLAVIVCFTLAYITKIFSERLEKKWLAKETGQGGPPVVVVVAEAPTIPLQAPLAPKDIPISKRFYAALFALIFMGFVFYLFGEYTGYRSYFDTLSDAEEWPHLIVAGLIYAFCVNRLQWFLQGGRS